MGVQSRGELTDETITVTKEGQWYVATDESSGIASQGETKVAALENLAEALALHERPVPESDENTADSSTAPWF